VKIVVATDRSETAGQAVRWADDFRRRFDAELVLLQVLTEPRDGAETELAVDAEALGDARAVVRIDPDPAVGIVCAAEEEQADVLVVGNAGMAGRREFLLGNVPNRVSHSARCTVVIVNTADGFVPEPPEEPEIEGRLLGRASEIARTLTRFGLEARKATSSVARAEALRRALEQLGPTFAKLGQILSTRPDLIPPEIVDELAKLQDDVKPLTEAEVVHVMEQELRVPWEDVFASIEPEPLAAGTIGQVHRATLENGEEVVVKVQRPTARDEIMRDLGLLELFAEKALDREGLRGTVDIPALVEHLSSSLRRELDFLEEARNVERMRELLAPYSRLDVPRIHHELSTSRLLVQGFVDGGPILEAPEGPERREAARQLLEAFYQQVLEDGFFHADPHPGNLLWSDGKIYLLDLGMVGQLDADVRSLLVLLLLAFWRNDPKFLAETMLLLAGEDGSPPDVDLESLEQDFAEFIGQFDISSLQDIKIGPMLDGLIRIAGRHGLRLPASLALSGKAFGQLQLAVAELDPTLDPFKTVGRFLLRSSAGKLWRSADPQQLYYEAQKLRLRLSRLFEAFERATGARPGAKLQVDFVRSTAIEREIARAGRRLALAATAAAALVASAMTAATGAAGWVSVVFGVAAAIFAVWLAIDIARPSRS
jgi:predicted unusual protein kinase regulating ubiquinone biosynthesis (AarF/ABC1/UbiB family)/nucleotide-binding universal stress UspA family protein